MFFYRYNLYVSSFVINANGLSIVLKITYNFIQLTYSYMILFITMKYDLKPNSFEVIVNPEYTFPYIYISCFMRFRIFIIIL